MLTVLNDIHNGTIRSAGTTPASQAALLDFTLDSMRDLLPEQGDLMLLGDLFDTNNVPLRTLWRTCIILNQWLDLHPDSKLYNVKGNHDDSKSSNVYSSFQFLGNVLKEAHPERYVHIEEPTAVPWGWVVPHMRNQDVFNLALSQVPDCQYLFVHCNYDNHFAAQSDQSLNMSVEQVEELFVTKVIFAHEHNARFSGKVVIPGNQVTTSVSDWLHSPVKRKVVISDSGEVSVPVVFNREDFYEELDWREATESTKHFVRIVGQATADEATAVVNTVNRIRKNSNAFVVANAVSIVTEGAEAVNFSDVLAGVQRFSVMASLRSYLTPEQFAKIESLC